MGNTNSTCSNVFQDLERNIDECFHPKLWKKFIEIIRSSAKAVADLFGKDIDEQEKILYRELFNGMDYLINHIDNLIPIIRNSMGQFQIIHKILDEDKEISSTTEESIKTSLEILSENYESMQKLTRQLDKNHKLHKEILKYQEKVLNEMNKKCLTLLDNTYSFLNKNTTKLVLAGMGGGGLAGGVTVGTLFAVSAFGGSGKFIAAGLSLTAASHVVGAILLGVMITTILSGIY